MVFILGSGWVFVPSLEFFAAREHRGTKEGVLHVGGPAEPAAGAEHGRHRALEDMQALAVLQVLLAGDIGQGRADRLEVAARRPQVGARPSLR